MGAEEQPKRGEKRSAEDGQDAGSGDAGSGEVETFLAGIGLSRYYPKLVGAGFDSMDALRAMEEEDMRQECGMLPGHIRLLQKHLNRSVGTGLVPTAEERSGEMSRRLAAREVGTLAAAASTFGSAVPSGSSVSELVQQAATELKTLRPAASAAAEGAASRPRPSPQQRRREPKGVPPPPGPTEESTKKVAVEREEAKQLELARKELADQMNERYVAAMQAAQANLSADPDPPGDDDTLAALAQLAEGSAQLVATAASFCANPQADANVLAAVVDAAQQGAQRASWAAVAAVAYGDSEDFDKEWSQKMRRAAVQAAEVAEQYARDCAATVKMVGKAKVVAKAFCKFHAANRCLKGATCEFSHDSATLTSVPLASKTELECIFFTKGECHRGGGCPFAHGSEELDEVLRLKTTAPGAA